MHFRHEAAGGLVGHSDASSDMERNNLKCCTHCRVYKKAQMILNMPWLFCKVIQVSPLSTAPQDCWIFLRESGDIAVTSSDVKSVKTDGALTNICCLSRQAREAKHSICITVNHMDIRQCAISSVSICGFVEGGTRVGGASMWPMTQSCTHCYENFVTCVLDKLWMCDCALTVSRVHSYVRLEPSTPHWIPQYLC